MRKYIIFFMVIGALISLLIFPVDFVSAKKKSPACNLSGTWRINNGFATFIPLDPNGKKFSVTVDAPIPENPTFGGRYLYATAVTPTRGVAFRVSRNLYKFTLSKIVWDGQTILGEVELSGQTKFIDCNHRVLVYTIRFLDDFGDEFECIRVPPTYT